MEGAFEAKPRVCFEVEKIIGVSSDGNFQVQWAPCWVSRFHLVGCENLIQEFLQQQQAVTVNHGEKLQEFLQQQQAVTVNHGEKLQEFLQQQQAVTVNHGEKLQEIQTDINIIPSRRHQVDVTDLNTIYQPQGTPTDHESIIPRRTDIDPSRRMDRETVHKSKVSEYETEMAPQEDVDEVDASLVGEPSNIEVRNERRRIMAVELTPDELLGNLVVKVEESEATIPDMNANTLSMVCTNKYSNLPDIDCYSETSDPDQTHEISMPKERNNLHNNGLSPHRGIKLKKKHFRHRGFGSSGHVRDHMMTHTGVRSFTCEYCQQEFAEKTLLKKHITQLHARRLSTVDEKLPKEGSTSDTASPQHKNNDPKKKYQCYVCERRFRSSGHLKDHIRTHTGIKPFSCEFCLERFIQKSNLKKHVRRYHPEPVKPLQQVPCEELSIAGNNELYGPNHPNSETTVPSMSECSNVGTS